VIATNDKDNDTMINEDIEGLARHIAESLGVDPDDTDRQPVIRALERFRWLVAHHTREPHPRGSACCDDEALP
jgi:hypothetical protein